MSTPAMRAIDYPCRCLCFGLVQMTITVPWRRMTLQLSQRALTEALTFNGSSTRSRPAVGRPVLRGPVGAAGGVRRDGAPIGPLLQAVGDPTAGQVVR